MTNTLKLKKVYSNKENALYTTTVNGVNVEIHKVYNEYWKESNWYAQINGNEVDDTYSTKKEAIMDAISQLNNN